MSKRVSNKPQQNPGPATERQAPAAESGNGHAENGNGNESRNGNANREEFSAEAIAARAYDIYEREGRVDGRDMEHWLKAEQELRAEKSQNRQSGAAEAAQNQTPMSRENTPRSARRHQENAV